MKSVVCYDINGVKSLDGVKCMAEPQLETLWCTLYFLSFEAN